MILHECDDLFIEPDSDIPEQMRWIAEELKLLEPELFPA